MRECLLSCVLWAWWSSLAHLLDFLCWFAARKVRGVNFRAHGQSQRSLTSFAVPMRCSAVMCVSGTAGGGVRTRGWWRTGVCRRPMRGSGLSLSAQE
jgi:hypothetical protein